MDFCSPLPRLRKAAQAQQKRSGRRRTEPNPSEREWGTAQQTPPSSIVSSTCTTYERVPQSAAAVAPSKKTVILSFLYFSFWQRLRWQREKEVLGFLFSKRCCCTLSSLQKKLKETTRFSLLFPSFFGALPRCGTATFAFPSRLQQKIAQG